MIKKTPNQINPFTPNPLKTRNTHTLSKTQKREKHPALWSKNSPTNHEADYANQIVSSRAKELTTLYKNLDAQIGGIILFQNRNSKEFQAAINEAKHLIDLIEDNEDRFNEFQATLGSFAISTTRYTSPNADANLDKAKSKPEIKQAKARIKQEDHSILVEQSIRAIKKYFHDLRIILETENPTLLVEELKKLYTNVEERLENNKHLDAVDQRQKEIQEIEDYISSNNKLKNTIESLAQKQRLSYRQRVELVKELKLITSQHPDLAKVKELVPDYNARVQDFISNIENLNGVSNIHHLIHQAARNFFAQNSEANDTPFVLGAFHEAQANINLQNQGYEVKAISQQYIPGKAFILDNQGNNLLAGIDFSRPQEALKKLQARDLLEKTSSNDNMFRFKGLSQSHLLYFDLENSKIVSHKKGRNTDDNRIFIRQSNGKFTKCEIDCVASKENIEHYIEHKINVSSLIKKNTKDKNEINQIEKLMIVAKAHGTKPVLMFDKTEICDANGNIDWDNPLAQELRGLISAAESKRPELGKVVLLDENAFVIASP